MRWQIIGPHHECFQEAIMNWKSAMPWKAKKYMHRDNHNMQYFYYKMDQIFAMWMRHTYHKEFLQRSKGNNRDKVGVDQYPYICDLGMYDIFTLCEFKQQTFPGSHTDPDSIHAFMPALVYYLEDGGYFGDFRFLCAVSVSYTHLTLPTILLV